MIEGAKKMKTDMLKRRRKALLALHGLTHVQIASEIGLSPSTVQVVVNGHRKSRRIQQHIADRLNVPFEKLWGTGGHHKQIVTNNDRAVND